MKPFQDEYLKSKSKLARKIIKKVRENNFLLDANKPIKFDSKLYVYTYNSLAKKESSIKKECFLRILERCLRVGSSSARLERVFSNTMRSLDHNRYHLSVRQLANEGFLRSFKVALPAILRLADLLDYESKTLEKAKKLFVIEEEPTPEEPSLWVEDDSFPEEEGEEEEEEVSKSTNSDHDHINYFYRSLNYHPMSFSPAVNHPIFENDHVTRKHRITKNARPTVKSK